MKTLKIKEKTLLTCTVLASFLALGLNNVFAETDAQLPVKAMQQEQAYRLQQQAFEQQDSRQEEQRIQEQRRYIKQKTNAELQHAEAMEEQKQGYLQAIEMQKPDDNKATENDINPQATQSEIEQELEKYEEQLKMQGSY